MTETTSAYQKLRGNLAYLRLTAAADVLATELDHASKEKLSHSAFLERLLGVEVQSTEERRMAGRRRFACLPAPWRLEDFDFDAQPRIDRKLVDELGTLRFIEEAANVLLIGPPGVGKTHLAVSLGHRAVEAGYRTYYTTALKGSIVLTTNRGITQWGQMFNDDNTVAADMLDRLLHRSTVLAIDGDSYRMRMHRERVDAVRRAIAPAGGSA